MPCFPPLAAQLHKGQILRCRKRVAVERLKWTDRILASVLLTLNLKALPARDHTCCRLLQLWSRWSLWAYAVCRSAKRCLHTFDSMPRTVCHRGTVLHGVEWSAPTAAHWALAVEDVGG